MLVRSSLILSPLAYLDCAIKTFNLFIRRRTIRNRRSDVRHKTASNHIEHVSTITIAQQSAPHCTRKKERGALHVSLNSPVLSFGVVTGGDEDGVALCELRTMGIVV